MLKRTREIIFYLIEVRVDFNGNKSDSEDGKNVFYGKEKCALKKKKKDKKKSI